MFSGLTVTFEVALLVSSAAVVLLLGHRLEVGRVDTPSVAAEMVELEALGHRPDQRLVDDPMSEP
jgi:hypothetical protein